MTLKLKPRERNLAAVAIGNIKLSMTSEEYGEAVDYLIEAESAIFDLRFSLSGRGGIGHDPKLSDEVQLQQTEQGVVVGFSTTTLDGDATKVILDIGRDEPNKLRDFDEERMRPVPVTDGFGAKGSSKLTK